MTVDPPGEPDVQQTFQPDQKISRLNTTNIKCSEVVRNEPGERGPGLPGAPARRDPLHVVEVGALAVAPVVVATDCVPGYLIKCQIGCTANTIVTYI